MRWYSSVSLIALRSTGGERRRPKRAASHFFLLRKAASRLMQAAVARLIPRRVSRKKREFCAGPWTQETSRRWHYRSTSLRFHARSGRCYRRLRDRRTDKGNAPPRLTENLTQMLGSCRTTSSRLSASYHKRALSASFAIHEIEVFLSCQGTTSLHARDRRDRLSDCCDRSLVVRAADVGHSISTQAHWLESTAQTRQPVRPHAAAPPDPGERSQPRRRRQGRYGRASHAMSEWF